LFAADARSPFSKSVCKTTGRECRLRKEIFEIEKILYDDAEEEEEEQLK
jgi:hypothetical protein